LAFTAAMDAGDFVMFRRTLLGIRDRAERLARHAPGAAEPQDLAPGRPLDFDLAVEIGDGVDPGGPITFGSWPSGALLLDLPEEAHS